jgi:hypothetical protein
MEQGIDHKSQEMSKAQSLKLDGRSELSQDKDEPTLNQGPGVPGML